MVLALTIPVLLEEWSAQGFNLVQVGAVATAMLIGLSCGGYIFGPIADKFGRKNGLIWCIAFFGITTGLTAFAQNYIQLGALRFLAGLGLGAEYALGGTMAAEFFPPETRGKLSSWVQMGWPVGFGAAVVAQYFLMPIWGWRSLYVLGTSAVFVGLYIRIFVPESPVWLKAQADRKKGIVTAGPPSARTRDLFKTGNLRAFLLVTLFFTAMLVCYWAVNTWLPTILAKQRGLSPRAYTNFLMFLQCASLAASLVGGIIADKFGKKKMMAISAFLSAATLYIWLGMDWDDNVFYAIGTFHWFIAGVVWAVAIGFTVEQFPTNIRAVGFASAFSTGRLLVTIAPLLMGAAAKQVGLTQVMTAVSIFYLIAMVAILLLKETKAHL
jgi:AAHS family cis,cis-muconate transporter-like MFS transporter